MWTIGNVTILSEPAFSIVLTGVSENNFDTIYFVPENPWNGDILQIPTKYVRLRYRVISRNTHNTAQEDVFEIDSPTVERIRHVAVESTTTSTRRRGM